MKRYLGPRTLVTLMAAALVTGCDPATAPGRATQLAGGIPHFTRDPEWGALPNDWVFGSVSGVATDADDNVWILHRPRSLPAGEAAHAAPPVVVLDSVGNLVSAWGGPGVGFDWPQSEHGIHIDAQGFVWISGNHCAEMGTPGLALVDDDQVLKFTPEGEIVLQIGHVSASQGNADTQNLHRPAALAVHVPTNELFVADGYGNHRVIVFDASSGRFKRMWGAFGAAPRDDDRCGAAFLGADAPAWDPEQFSIVHALAVSADGLVYVADRENGRVQVFTIAGEYLRQIEDDTSLMSVALSPDPEQRYLYIWGGAEIQVRDRASLDLLTTIPDDPGQSGPGHLMAADSLGNLYLARLGGGIEKLIFNGITPQ